MRTTIELPDELLNQAKQRSAVAGITLRQFFILAVEQRLMPEKRKVRRPPPAIGSADSPTIGILTSEQLDEVMFG